jgi:uncharacterized membrane protein YgcG
MGTEELRDFDEWLERELRQKASGEAAPNPLPSQARYHAVSLRGRALGRLSFVIAALVSTNAATALAMSAVVVVAAGAATEAVITGSANPVDWGHQVVQQVEKCKDALAPGGHSVGDCASSFASRHGQQESTTHKASDARQNAPASPASHPPGGPPSSHPGGGPPTSHPGGGPPSSHPSVGNSGGNSGNDEGGSGHGHDKP